MISKSQISFIKSLHHKKFRKEHGLFLVEGIKSVTEFIHSDYLVETVYCTENVMPKLANLTQNLKVQQISQSDLDRISSLNTSQEVLALIRIPEKIQTNASDLKGKYVLALDGIQDPGNLGTIIRTADWFGIKDIICSEETVDAYNPKVVQASMGSLPRINISYCHLPSFLEKSLTPIYGALLEGKSIYQTAFTGEGVIILGNEGKGISPEAIKFVKHSVTIPRYGEAESLNVAISAAVFCSELRRNISK